MHPEQNFDGRLSRDGKYDRSSNQDKHSEDRRGQNRGNGSGQMRERGRTSNQFRGGRGNYRGSSFFENRESWNQDEKNFQSEIDRANLPEECGFRYFFSRGRGYGARRWHYTGRGAGKLPASYWCEKNRNSQNARNGQQSNQERNTSPSRRDRSFERGGGENQNRDECHDNERSISPERRQAGPQFNSSRRSENYRSEREGYQNQNSEQNQENRECRDTTPERYRRQNRQNDKGYGNSGENQNRDYRSPSPSRGGNYCNGNQNRRGDHGVGGQNYQNRNRSRSVDSLNRRSDISTTPERRRRQNRQTDEDYGNSGGNQHRDYRSPSPPSGGIDRNDNQNRRRDGRGDNRHYQNRNRSRSFDSRNRHSDNQYHSSNMRQPQNENRDEWYPEDNQNFQCSSNYSRNMRKVDDYYDNSGKDNRCYSPPQNFNQSSRQNFRSDSPPLSKHWTEKCKQGRSELPKNRQLWDVEDVDPRCKFNCVFCEGKHLADACPQIRNLEERRQFLENREICCRCLGVHRTKDCYKNYSSCSYCHGNSDMEPHHTCLCDTPITKLPPSEMKKPTRYIKSRFSITEISRFPCVFCGNKHFPDECWVIVDVKERREFLEKNNYCLKCILPHLTKYCEKMDKDCYYCAGNLNRELKEPHNQCICPLATILYRNPDEAPAAQKSIAIKPEEVSEQMKKVLVVKENSFIKSAEPRIADELDEKTKQ